jgi:flagellar motor switch protein FliM
MLRVAVPLLAWIRRTWQPLIDLQPAAEPPLSQASGSDSLPEDQRIVCVRWQASLGGVSGWMELEIPCHCLAALGSKLLAPNWTDAGEHVVSGSAVSSTSAPVELTAELSTSYLPESELRKLAVGDIIATDHAADQPLRIHVRGQRRFRGTLGADGVHKAVRIESRIASP